MGFNIRNNTKVISVSLFFDREKQTEGQIIKVWKKHFKMFLFIFNWVKLGVDDKNLM